MSHDPYYSTPLAVASGSAAAASSFELSLPSWRARPPRAAAPATTGIRLVVVFDVRCPASKTGFLCLRLNSYHMGAAHAKHLSTNTLTRRAQCRAGTIHQGARRAYGIHRCELMSANCCRARRHTCEAATEARHDDVCTKRESLALHLPPKVTASTGQSSCGASGGASCCTCGQKEGHGQRHEVGYRERRGGA